MRTSRWLAPLLAAAMLAAPTAASAQEAEPVEPVEETTTTTDPADVLAGWLSAIREVVEVLTVAPSEGEDGDDTGDAELTDEQRAALEELAALLRDGISARATILRLEDAGEAEEETEGDEGDDEAGSKGEIVSTVARCAPRGRDGGLVDGARNHGWWVSTAARGGTVTLAVPQVDTSGEAPVVGEAVDVELDLSTLEGAEALCAAIATIREADALLAELDEEEPTAKEQRAEERAERKAARAEEREERKADRDRAKAERAEERAERKAARAGGRPAGADGSDDGDED